MKYIALYRRVRAKKVLMVIVEEDITKLQNSH